MSDTPKNVLITGAAGGLGSTLAQICAEQGAQLLLVDKDLRGLERVCDQVEAVGQSAPAFCQLDLAQAGPEQLGELLNGFIGEFGDLDALAHCAVHFDGLAPLDQVPGDRWLTGMQVNVNAAWLLTVSCLPSLRHGDGGNIVFLLDDEQRSGSAFWGEYGVAKAAVRSLAAMLADELEDSNCRVYGVDPGPMRTQLRASAYMAENPQEIPEPDLAARYIAGLLLGEAKKSATFHRVPVV